MDEQKAIRLLDETFRSDFDIERYARFIKELFNIIGVDIKDKTPYIASQFKEYIAECRKIGEYEDTNRKKIEVLAVRLKKSSSRDRARTMQRNFVSTWLGKYDIDGALVAFYGDDPQDWRFSFVKMEYNLVKDESGKVIVSKELTPAKRYSFLVGVNEPNHTCASQFVDLIRNEEVNPSLEKIESAFSIEKVTKEFFLGYKELFLELEESLQKVINKDDFVKKEFEEKNISTVDFAKKLLGQIVFIYFLQKKGWLGVQKDESGRFKEWGTGPKDFMRKLFDKKIVHYGNFFNEVLEPLFYEALAEDRTANHDYYSRFNCKIPFLNGGLFEPINEYDWAGTEIVLDNAVFKNIFDTFDRFNFTVKEDEPLEKEVAVDPEMLGKVFENLLEVKDRKSKGAFYTPREIVHYMCQQSLINYIETNTSIERKDIERVIQLGDFALDQIIKEQEQIKKYGRSYDIKEEYTLPSIKENCKEIDRLLKNIKIVDPACGSGAFLVGMMNEIVKARSILSIYFKEERKDYGLKREMIENCLYGVDIEPSAVQICKLRFWLSLIVDEIDVRNIKPLPNLDYKIMCGNSLLEEFEGVKLFDEKLLGEVKRDFSHELEQIDKEIGKLNKEKGDIALGKKENNGRSRAIEREIKRLNKKKNDLQFGPKEKIKDRSIWDVLQHRIKESQKKLNELKKLYKQFFNEQNRNKKKQLRADIDKIEWELIKETLKEQGNEEAMQKLEQYKKNKAKPFFLWKLYFAEVFQRENPGFDVVIANPPYVDSRTSDAISKAYWKKYYESPKYGKTNSYEIFIERGLMLLRNKGNLRFIVPIVLLEVDSCKGLRKFLLTKFNIDEIAYGKQAIFKDANVDTMVISIFNQTPFNSNIRVKQFSDDLSAISTEHILKVKNITEENDFRFFIKTNPVTTKLLLRKNEFIKISSVLNFYNGIATGPDKDKYISYQKQNSNYKPLIMGNNIGHYLINYDGKFINYDRKMLHRPRDEDIFLIDEKIVMQRIRNLKLDRRLVCALDIEQYYTFNSVNNLLKKEKDNYNIRYFLALLNSNLLNFVLKQLSVNTNITLSDLELLPIKPISFQTSEKNPHDKIVNLVDQILSITKDDDYLDNPDKQFKVKRLEEQIDNLVYELYELTPEEIKIVKEFGGK